ncbi:hypothetical protein BSKO_02685 [Bryopsis sp. KO-2023]|nr:hypothetical protein BSKO_02685 [Bryopsis sp. KO-2023]
MANLHEQQKDLINALVERETGLVVPQGPMVSFPDFAHLPMPKLDEANQLGAQVNRFGTGSTLADPAIQAVLGNTPGPSFSGA